jgi:hypothetical protein
MRKAVLFSQSPCCFTFYVPGFQVPGLVTAYCWLSLVRFLTDVSAFCQVTGAVYSNIYMIHQITFWFHPIVLASGLVTSDYVCSRLLMLSAVAVSVLAVSCCILFPFPLQYVYSCCRYNTFVAVAVAVAVAVSLRPVP